LRFIHILIMAMVLTIAASAVSFSADKEATENEDGWDVNADINLNLTQNSYNEDWEGSELGSISWSALGLMSAENQISQKCNWSTIMRLAFGQTHTQKEIETENGSEKKWQKPSKSTDDIDLESMMRFTLGKFIDPYFSARMQTKFTNENNEMFDPKEFTESVGIANEFIKTERTNLVSRIGFSLRQHLRKDFDATSDGGLEFVTDYHHIFSEDRIIFDSTLRLFQAMIYSESDEEGVNDDWQSLDLDWKNNLSLNVIGNISISVYLQLLYDKDHQTSDGVQIKQTLGVGFSYKLL